jgi:hypothetical protein
MSEVVTAIPKLRNIGIGMLALGILGSAVGFFAGTPKAFFHSYLIGYMFWFSIATGSLAILMIQHLTGGGWAYVIRRSLEAAAKTLPLLAILAIPIVLGMGYLYSWSHPELVAKDIILQKKAPYLNSGFFIARLVVYFVIWSGMAYFLGKKSVDQDKTGTTQEAVSLAKSCERLSAPGLVVYALTMTLAMVDLVMSLDPHWISTIFGILMMGNQLLSGLAFSLIAVVMLTKSEPMSKIVHTSQFHDLGKILKGFVLLWSYFSLSQFLIIWSGNLPEETPWYLNRMQGGWEVIGVLIMVGCFALPFFILLLRDVKRNPGLLSKVAIYLLIMRVVDLFWVIKPQVNIGDHLRFDISDPFPLLAIGGAWLLFYATNLQQASVIPQKDPYMNPEKLAHSHH